MEKSSDRLPEQFMELLKNTEYINRSRIPEVDLYMDQVLAFMNDHLKYSARDPEHDRILTKTMINNYVKNGILMAPDKKKYSPEHMMILMMIFYLKSFLSIEDIGQILQPVKDAAGIRRKHAEPVRDSGQEKKLELGSVYDEIFAGVNKSVEFFAEDFRRKYADAMEAFDKEDLPAEEKERLRRVYLVCQMGAEIYLYKLLIERMIDAGDFDGTQDAG